MRSSSHLLLILSVLAGVLLAGPVAAESTAPLVQEYQTGQIDWQNGLITATGYGSPPRDARNAAQARALALRAATTVARRNLLEIIQGVHIESTTTVANYMVENDAVRSTVEGFLQNSQVLSSQVMNDGSAQVVVGVMLRGPVAEAIMPPTIPFSTRSYQEPAMPDTGMPEVSADIPDIAPAPSSMLPPGDPTGVQERDLGQGYTGLIVHAPGLSIRPAMSPRILDEDGEEVYSAAFAQRDYAIQQGVAGYGRDLAQARNNERVGENPLVVTALAVSGEGSTDLVIGNQDAEQLRNAARVSDFLRECRVMIVLD